MNASIIWNELTKHFSNAGAAAILGNLFLESGLKSNNLENRGNSELSVSDELYTAFVDSGEYVGFATDGYGYGLAQWTYPTRKEGLFNLAKKRKTSVANMETQLEYLLQELNGYQDLNKELQISDDIAKLTERFMKEFEKPANQSETAVQNRIFYAKKYFDTLSDYTYKEVEEYYTLVEIRKALEVRKGKYGVYPERKEKLESDGFHYDKIQKLVNILIGEW